MILYLVGIPVFFIAFIVGFIFRESEWCKKEFLVYFGRVMFISIIIPAVIHTIVLCRSYTTYVQTRTQYDAVINQYRGAIELYSERASLNLAKAALTDFKYQGYQDNMSAIIIQLRKSVVEYNKTIISKRIMKKNLLFSWLIIAPDEDMKIINII